MIRVQIVDDHKILVEGLNNLINSTTYACVVNIANTGRQCIQQLAFDRPDVILLDINLPDIDGAELCKEIKTKYPKIKVIALTGYKEYAMVQKLLKNGADGYVIKNAMPEEILKSIIAVQEEQIFLCEQIDTLINKKSNNQIWLTPREKELLQFIVQGFTNPEIADKMHLGIETINSYRKKLLYKLNARNTAVLVKIAIEQKLI